MEHMEYSNQAGGADAPPGGERDVFSGSNGGDNGSARPVRRGSVAGAAQSTSPSEERGQALRDYITVLWRRKWVILAIVVVATLAAYFASASRPKEYSAKADLVYEVSLDISNPLTGQAYVDPTQRQVDLLAVGSVLSSPDMKARAAKLLRQEGDAITGFKVTAAPLTQGSAGSSDSLYSSVVRITATSTIPRLAAAAANASAVAFVVWRKEQVQAQIAIGIDALKKKMAGYTGAAKQSTEYLVMAQRLQDLQLLKSTATGNFRVLAPATVPTSPDSPKPIRTAAMGLALGFLAAIGIAFLLEQLDTRLRRDEDAAVILRQPILGRIPRISKAQLGESPVVALRHPDGQAAEAFRLLRTNLEFMRVDDDVKSLVVTSAVQGEGKSVCVANLAVTLALGGKKVFIVDADLRRPRQHQYFGLDNTKGVSTVVTGQTALVDTLQRVDLEPRTGANDVDFKAWAQGTEALSRVYVLPSGPLPPNPGEIVSSKGFGAMMAELAGEADVIIVDSPAMLAVGDTAGLAAMVDGLVFLIDVHVARRPVLQQATEQLLRLPCRSLGLVLRTDAARSGSYYSSYRYVQGSDGSRKRRDKQAVPAAKG